MLHFLKNYLELQISSYIEICSKLQNGGGDRSIYKHEICCLIQNCRVLKMTCLVRIETFQ